MYYYILCEKTKGQQNNTALLNEQSIKLQWFKELTIQPNKDSIALFYSNLHTIRQKINSNDLTIEEKEDINNFAKAELAVLRKCTNSV